MPDFVYDIKDSLLGVWDSIRDALPLDKLEEHKEYVLPGVGAFLAVLAVLFTVGASSRASKLQDNATRYRAGQQQMAVTLGEIEEPAISEEDEATMGKADLILQYKSLSELPETNSFSKMEKMADVASSIESSTNNIRDNSYYDLIRQFAGNFGGVLTKSSESSGTIDLRLAAYRDAADLQYEAPDGVSNILVQHLKRTIPSNQYGVEDKTDTLVILSGTDIANFSSIGKGSIMYTTFGASNGTKASRKYVCTGIEPGMLDESVYEKNGSTEAENNGSTETEAETTTTHPQTGPNDVKSVADDGTVTYEDGTIVSPNGYVTYSDGTVVTEDGTVIYPDGMIIDQDGNITGGKLVPMDGESEAGTEGTTDGTDNGSGSFDFGADSIFTRNVFAANNTNILDNKTDSLIFYVVNSRTGAVTITYWNLAGSEAANAAQNL